MSETPEHTSVTEAATDSCGCSTRHPLEKDGTSQAQRLLAALDTSFVAVDERRLEDLLVFARNYAKLLNFHKVKLDLTSGKKVVGTENDWDVFLRKDVSVLVAAVSKENVNARRIGFKRKLNALNQSPDATTLRDLFPQLVTILKNLNEWYTESDELTLFHQDMDIYFQSVFLEGYLKLYAVDGGATAIGETNGLEALGDLEFNSKWSALIAAHSPAADITIYDGDTADEQVKAAAFAVQTVFEKFAGVLQMIVDRAAVYLEQTIEQYPYHKAHMGLFITFLELFAYAQKHINRITDRHLNFFYQEVLRIAPKEAVADKVHLIFQLAKNVVDPYKVNADVLLKAGKDEKNIELFYGTDDEIILNQAKTVLFKNLFIDKVKVAPDAAQPNVKVTTTGMFGASVANSSDGAGGDLDEDIPQWKAFGSSQQGVETSERTLQDATTGFAVASPQLVLNEGNRIITLKIDFETNPDLADSGIAKADLENGNNYKFSFTSEKGWLTPDAPVITFTSGSKTLWFKFTVRPQQAAITPYNAAVHGGSFSVSQPMLKVELLNFKVTGTDAHWNNLYAALKKAVVKKLVIDLDISEVRNLTLHNEFSPIDVSKPFMPFGQQPVPGSPFFVGSKEIFFKKLDKLTLHVDWHGAPADFSKHYKNYMYNDDSGVAQDLTGISNSSFTATYKVLADGKWPLESATGSNFESYNQAGTKQTNNLLFDTSAATGHVSYVFNSVHAARAGSDDVFDEKVQGSTRGFLKLALGAVDFKHSTYAMSLAKKAIAEANLPLAPYTPSIKSFSASYKSEEELDNVDDQFFHLHPFGEQQVEVPPVTGDEDGVLYRYLLPQFVRTAVNATTGNEERREQKGMLFIALEGLVPQQSVSLLVQVVEDSGNNDAQAPTINWSYLRNNEWVSLTRQQVASDTSNGFLTSGIVELDIPRDATSTNTIFPSGYHWLRASVEEYTDMDGLHDPSALNNVLSITAQAVQASFRDNGNDPSHLATPLTAETITKLAEPLAAVKSVAQPYASFGGKIAEQGTDYYRRVSERLRHKGRAVTMWDYERLILEYFPSIYKVKCISHTLDVTGSDKLYSELVPGSVCVTVVSNLRNQNQVNLLRPTTSINTRNEIVKFLAKRASRFARISVINPEYEAIQVKCKVTYMPEYQKDKGYYDTVLIADIKKFLSPWAYDEGADIVFGGKMHSSYIINFIEERPYVDYLTDFEMYKEPEGNDDPQPREELSATHAKTILVSADTHLINADSE